MVDGTLENNAPNKVSRSEWAAIALIAIVALVLRFYKIDQAFWYDEIITLTEAVRMAPADLVRTYGSLNNHVLYTWLAKASIALFGETPFALRLPAALFGVGSIVATFALYRQGAGRLAAIVAAALLALSYHHEWFSQNGRGYTGLLLFTTLALIYLDRAVRRDRIADWATYGVMIAVAMLIHLSAAFAIAAQALVVIWVRRKAWIDPGNFWNAARGPISGYALGAAITIIAFLPMIGGMIETFASVSGATGHPAHQVIEWKNPVWTIVESVRTLGPVAFAAPLAFGFIAIGIWRLCRTAPIIAATYLVQIPLTFLVLIALSMRIWPRYFFIDIGFLFVTMVVGAFVVADVFWRGAGLEQRTGKSAMPLKIVGSAFMMLASLPLLARNFDAPKQDFEGALGFVEGNMASGETIGVVGLSAAYYDGYRNLGWPVIETISDLDTQLAQNGRLWIVTAFPAQFRAYYPEIAARLERDFEPSRRFRGTVSGGDLEVFVSKGD